MTEDGGRPWLELVLGDGTTERLDFENEAEATGALYGLTRREGKYEEGWLSTPGGFVNLAVVVRIRAAGF